MAPALSDRRPARRLPGSFLAALAVACGIVAVSLFTVGLRQTLISETAGLELASAVTLWWAAVVALVWAVRAGLARFWAVPLGIVLLALREHDFQNWFFDPGLVRVDLLTGPALLWQKAVGLAVLLLILATLIRLAWLGWRPMLAGLRTRAGWAWALLTGIALAALSTQVDGLGGDLDRAGWALGETRRAALLLAEEAAELAFALSVMLATSLARRTGAGPSPTFAT